MVQLCLVLLIEISLSWRKTLLREMDVHLGRIRECSEENGHACFHLTQSQGRNSMVKAEESVAQPTLRHASEGTVSPFRDYLLHLASRIDQPDIVRLEDIAPNGDAVVSVCDGELQRLTGGSREVAEALQSERVRIIDTPAELMAERARLGSRLRILDTPAQSQ
ncbi:MAG: hypothetical protein OXF72_04575 [Gammaproteobacteria bacterium]|nr:hypothetical protein [Gammaproteobacteria bacterium]MCY4276788.1 hypothetical protein [Gammaproteobacteria bacterium]